MSESPSTNLIAALPGVLSGWESAYAERRRVERDTERSVGRAQRRLEEARAGLRSDRYEQARSGRASLNTAADARSINRALRRVGDLGKAEAELRTVLAERESAVRQADAELAQAARRLLLYGTVANEVTGLSNRDLQRLVTRTSKVAR